MNKLEEIIERVDREWFEENHFFLSASQPTEFAKVVAIEFGKILLEEACDNAEVMIVDHEELEVNILPGYDRPEINGRKEVILPVYGVDEYTINNVIKEYL